MHESVKSEKQVSTDRASQRLTAQIPCDSQ